jgi:transcriptional regulator with XRE-family HTH domain
MARIDPFEDSRELARALREKVGVSTGYASDLALRRRTPSLALALKIEELIGVPVNSWAKGDVAPHQGKAA